MGTVLSKRAAELKFACVNVVMVCHTRLNHPKHYSRSCVVTMEPKSWCVPCMPSIQYSIVSVWPQ